MWQLNETGDPLDRVYDGASLLLRQVAAPMELALAPVAERVERLRVRFATPTELKSGQQVADRPEFGVLASRIRDRLSTLRESTTAARSKSISANSASAPAGASDALPAPAGGRNAPSGDRAGPSIGGFVGEAEYEGDLAEFGPSWRREMDGGGAADSMGQG